MVAKFMDLNRLWSYKYGRKKRCTQNKTVADAFLSSFYSANVRLFPERLLRSRNHATTPLSIFEIVRKRWNKPTQAPSYYDLLANFKESGCVRSIEC